MESDELLTVKAGFSKIWKVMVQGMLLIFVQIKTSLNHKYYSYLRTCWMIFLNFLNKKKNQQHKIGVLKKILYL